MRLPEQLGRDQARPADLEHERNARVDLDEAAVRGGAEVVRVGTGRQPPPPAVLEEQLAGRRAGATAGLRVLAGQPGAGERDPLVGGVPGQHHLDQPGVADSFRQHVAGADDIADLGDHAITRLELQAGRAAAERGAPAARPAPACPSRVALRPQGSLPGPEQLAPAVGPLRKPERMSRRSSSRPARPPVTGTWKRRPRGPRSGVPRKESSAVPLAPGGRSTRVRPPATRSTSERPPLS